ncbi:hypothetical protein BVY03_02330 [bacterium K02(2017)]|nr:hypothetical protein BVY03_02330 [bacterium K02(2017)]
MKDFLGMPWLPINAAAHGDVLDNMLIYVHYLMIPLAIGWGAYFVYALYRFSAKRNPKANYHGVKTHISSYVEILVILCEVVLLVGFSIPLWDAVANTFPAPEDSIEMGIIAEQFAWNFHYAGPDGKFGKRSPKLVDSQTNPLGLDFKNDANAADDFVAKTMHIQKDKPVIAHVTSKDVIHALGIPVMRVKQDAIPGINIPVTFTPIKTGKFMIACSQLCGSNHSQMRGLVYVHTKEEYEAWYAKEVAAAKAAGEEEDAW